MAFPGTLYEVLLMGLVKKRGLLLPTRGALSKSTQRKGVTQSQQRNLLHQRNGAVWTELVDQTEIFNLGVSACELTTF